MPITSVFKFGDGVSFSADTKHFLSLSDVRFQYLIPSGNRERCCGRTLLEPQTTEGGYWLPTKTGLVHFSKFVNVSDLASAFPTKVYRTVYGLSTNSIFNLFEDSRGAPPF